jgi:hypothetical protein
LRRERVGGAESDIGAAVAQRDGEVRRLSRNEAEMRMPLSGWLLMKSLRMICRTFIDWFAQSMRFLPISASSRLAISPGTRAVVVDIISCLKGHGFSRAVVAAYESVILSRR